MKKIMFGIAVILFGFSTAYISVQANWAIMELASMLAIVIGLIFSILGFVENEK